jgi:hypothetical protein
MAEISYSGQQYRLRCGTPMPVGGGGSFMLHTFMAEVNDVVMYSCTSSLPGSEQFRGQGGNMMSASFTRLNSRGGGVFSGKIVYAPKYVDEDEIS